MSRQPQQSPPTLTIPASPTLQSYLAHSPTVSAPSSEPTCPICYDDWESASSSGGIIRTHCGHNFHRECLTAWFGNAECQSANTCPSCRAVCFPSSVVEKVGVQINGERSPNANDISFLYESLMRVA